MFPLNTDLLEVFRTAETVILKIPVPLPHQKKAVQ